MNVSNPVVTFNDVPNEIVSNIALFLDRGALAVIRGVERRCRVLLDDVVLWRKLIAKGIFTSNFNEPLSIFPQPVTLHMKNMYQIVEVEQNNKLVLERLPFAKVDEIRQVQEPKESMGEVELQTYLQLAIDTPKADFPTLKQLEEIDEFVEKKEDKYLKATAIAALICKSHHNRESFCLEERHELENELMHPSDREEKLKELQWKKLKDYEYQFASLLEEGQQKDVKFVLELIPRLKIPYSSILSGKLTIEVCTLIGALPKEIEENLRKIVEEYIKLSAKFLMSDRVVMSFDDYQGYIMNAGFILSRDFRSKSELGFTEAISLIRGLAEEYLSKNDWEKTIYAMIDNFFPDYRVIGSLPISKLKKGWLDVLVEMRINLKKISNASSILPTEMSASGICFLTRLLEGKIPAKKQDLKMLYMAKIDRNLVTAIYQTIFDDWGKEEKDVKRVEQEVDDKIKVDHQNEEIKRQEALTESFIKEEKIEDLITWLGTYIKKDNYKRGKFPNALFDKVLVLAKMVDNPILLASTLIAYHKNLKACESDWVVCTISPNFDTERSPLPNIPNAYPRLATIYSNLIKEIPLNLEAIQKISQLELELNYIEMERTSLIDSFKDLGHKDEKLDHDYFNRVAALFLLDRTDHYDFTPIYDLLRQRIEEDDQEAAETISLSIIEALLDIHQELSYFNCGKNTAFLFLLKAMVARSPMTRESKRQLLCLLDAYKDFSETDIRSGYFESARSAGVTVDDLWNGKIIDIMKLDSFDLKYYYQDTIRFLEIKIRKELLLEVYMTLGEALSK